MMAHLERWQILTLWGSGYQAPEQARQILCGVVTDHPKMQDGIYVETSPIESVWDDEVLTRTGTSYTLGEPDPDYEAEFPNARERVLSRQIPASKSDHIPADRWPACLTEPRPAVGEEAE